jgi:hypothetical protein
MTLRIAGLFIIISLLISSAVYALSLEFENQSSWEIHELYFSEADESSWGPDQLGSEVIESGETFELTKIDKGDYDVKIVDEDGDSCEIRDVDFTSSEHFTLTNELLLGCQVATAVEE